MLTEAEKRLRDDGVSLWLVGLNPGVLAMVRRSPLGETLGRDRMFFNLEQAVARYCTGRANDARWSLQEQLDRWIPALLRVIEAERA